MESIVVGYDGSPASRAAVDWVAERTRRRPGLVQLVTITNMFLSERPEAQSRLESAARELEHAAPGITVETHTFDGVMPATLLDVSRGTDVLVIGVDTGHPLRQALHGWKSLRTGARAHAPTFLIPRQWSDHVGPVSVGLDDDESSDAALEFAAAEAERWGEALRVVHSWSITGSQQGAPSPRQAARDHHACLAQAIARVLGSRPGLRTESHIAHSNPVSALTTASATSSLVVLGTHGRGVLAGGFLGSTTQDLIGIITAPICVVPPRTAEEDAEERVETDATAEPVLE